MTPVEASPGARRQLRLTSPASLEPVGEIEVQTADDVAAAVARARAAQPGWAARPVAERARVARRALEILLARQDEFIDVIVRESGKPRTEAILMEIYAGCDALAYWSKRAEAMLRPERRRLHGVLALAKECRIVHRPRGLVAVITPWNGPFILSLNPTIQALLAGNAVVLKPSEVTPFSGRLVGDLLAEAGLPDGVLQVLLGDGETGTALVDADLDMVCFTGSVATGRKVAEACARRLVPCTLELGGKDPMIVCADADLDRAAGGAVAGAFLNSGQVCCGIERVYVVDAVADEFTRRVVERAGALRQGASGEFDVGPLFWPRQLEIVEAHVEDAVARGARVLVGGRRNPELKGLFYEPTVLADVDHDMRIMREETFGPVLPIMRAADEEEAVRLANDTSYGLGALVWSGGRDHALEVAGRLQAGSVCINDINVTYGVPEAPFGGRRSSGLGQVNGADGLRSFCHAQPVLRDRFGGRQAAGSYPYSTRRDAGTQRFIRFLWGTRLGRWFS